MLITGKINFKKITRAANWKRGEDVKKIVVISLFVFLSVALAGWSVFEAKQDSPKLPIEMVAANSLTKAEESLILVSPKDSQVEKVVVNEEVESLIDKNYNKNKVYKITFNQTATEAQGNLIVFVGVDKKTVVGKGFDEKITAEDMEDAYHRIM